jgi:hypothetical protein
MILKSGPQRVHMRRHLRRAEFARLFAARLAQWVRSREMHP